MMGHMLGGFGSGPWGLDGLGWFGMVFNLAISVGLIVGLVLLIAWLWRRVNAGAGAPVSVQPAGGVITSPKEMLQIRYVRGEITREQYQQMLADLG